MRFNINNNLRHNLFFLGIFLLLLHILATNIAIFNLYWEEKLYWSEKVEYPSNQTYFGFEDYDEYISIDSHDIFFLCYESWTGLLVICFYCVLFIFYVIIPSIKLFIDKKIDFIFLLIIDILVLSLSTYILIEQNLYNSMIGVIPLYILIPILFFILIAFRIYQYMKKLIFKS